LTWWWQKQALQCRLPRIDNCAPRAVASSVQTFGKQLRADFLIFPKRGDRSVKAFP